MSRKLNRTTIASTLEAAKTHIGYDFIIEVSAHKKQFAARIKGLNGEIVMNQENVDTKANAEYIAARLIKGGLSAKYKDLTPTPKVTKSGKAKPVKYPKL